MPQNILFIGRVVVWSFLLWGVFRLELSTLEFYIDHFSHHHTLCEVCPNYWACEKSVCYSATLHDLYSSMEKTWWCEKLHNARQWMGWRRSCPQSGQLLPELSPQRSFNIGRCDGHCKPYHFCYNNTTLLIWLIYDGVMQTRTQNLTVLYIC